MKILIQNTQPSEQDLIRFLSTHDEAKEFQCKFCNASYTTEEEFKKHFCFMEIIRAIKYAGVLE